MKITESRLREIIEEEIMSEMHVGKHGGLSVTTGHSADRAASRDDDYHFGFDPESNPPKVGSEQPPDDFQSEVTTAANKIAEIATSNPDEMEAVQEIVQFVQQAFATSTGSDNYRIRMALDVAAEQNSDLAMLFMAIKEEFPLPDWAKKLDHT